jgi:hypothetical protein
MDQGNGARWLKLAQAAPQLGLTIDGLRARIKRGQITTRKGNDGRLLVSVAANGAEPSSHEPSHEPAQNGSGAGHESAHEPAGTGSDGAGHNLLLDLLDARERAARAEGELAGLREALATEARRSTDLQAVLELERARADRLEAALAEARKGWLERLLEAVRRR